MTSLPTKNDFIPLLHETFEVKIQSVGSFYIELLKIDDRSNEFWEGFSLLFSGPLNHVFAQGNHKIKHDQIGEFDLFIVPVEYLKKDSMYYQAVFSSLKK
ncbi:MAG TPA: hypothetical protein PLP19_14410 [bacterium]|nr:hypothetical protein [bacterium]HPN44683.1 hypothetical protein [bacterium]